MRSAPTAIFMRAENPSRHGAGPSVGIAGAGLLGRLLAWRLAHAGWRVSVFDPAEGAGPVFRSQAPDPYVPTAAGFTAAGMLSPLAELDNAEPGEAALGWRSIELWRDIAANLPQAPYFRAEGSLMLAHRTDLGAAQRVLSLDLPDSQAWALLAASGGHPVLAMGEWMASANPLPLWRDGLDPIADRLRLAP